MRVAPILTSRSARLAEPPLRGFGIVSLDVALAGGVASGMARGHAHEVYAAEVEDAAAAVGFAMALAAGFADRQCGAGRQGGAGRQCGADRPRGVLWLRSRRALRGAGLLQANGWRDLGGTPGANLVCLVPDNTALLRAAVEGLRCPALGAVVVEGWGSMRELDLTASRRLSHAAGKSGVPLLLLRIDAAPVPSAAQTRWQVTAAPSVALPGNAPGLPCFDVTLLRQRSGPSGQSWRLEWNRDRCQFREAPLSGAVVSVPADRPAAQRTGGPDRGAGRHAA